MSAIGGVKRTRCAEDEPYPEVGAVVHHMAANFDRLIMGPIVPLKLVVRGFSGEGGG